MFKLLKSSRRLLAALMFFLPRVIPAATSPEANPSVVAPAAPPPPQLLSLPRARLAEIFSPDRTGEAALSPDGRHLAYSVREGAELSVVIVEVDHPETIKARVQVATDKTSTPAFVDGAAERVPAAIRWMGWVTPSRLLVETNGNFATMDNKGVWVNAPGIIYGMDADGRNAGVLLTPRDVTYQTLDFEAFAKPNSFVAPIASVDQPVSDVSPSNPDNPGDSSDPSTQPLTALRPAATTLSYRSPHIQDFIAGQPGAVLIRAEGGSHLGRYKLDGVTGKLTSLSDDVFDGEMVSLLDRQARPRIAVPANLRKAFPHDYAVDLGTGFLRWKKLDVIAGSSTGKPGFHVSPENFFGERAVPVGFDENPDVLYYASNVGRDTYALYSLDLKSGQRKGFSFENPHLDLIQPDPGRFARNDPLVFDRFKRELIGVRFETWWRTSRWLRPEWQAAQATAEKTLPGRSAEIIGWDEAARRFLIFVHGPSDPGAYFVFDAAKPNLAEFVRCAPTIDEKKAGQTAVLNFNDAAGRQIGALLTLPNSSRPTPAALVVVCNTEPWQRVHTDYRRDIQALSEMGLAVLQVNGRGAFGFGIKQREAIKSGYEESQIDDILSTLDYLKKYLPLNFNRVVTFGADWGGFVALRAVQLHPDRFRCAIALDPTVDPGDWLDNSNWGDDISPGPALTRSYYGDAARLKTAPLASAPQKMAKPFLVLSYRGKIAASHPTPKFLVARRFTEAARSAHGVAEFAELTQDYMHGLPLARAAAFEKIQGFLNEALFKFEVKIGETKEVKP